MHVSVLLNEVVDLLSIRPDGIYLDVTGGAGGHAAEIVSRLGPSGRLLITDRDPQAVAGLERRFEKDERCFIKRARFSEVLPLLQKLKIAGVDGLVADLGISSLQLDDSAYGLTFSEEGPLDMRLDPDLEFTAADIVNEHDEEDLANLIYQWGEERLSRKIARRICREREHQRFETTAQLARVVAQAVGGGRHRIHPATRTFQALRIAVNGELQEVEALLNDLEKILRPKGRAGIISFHSLEDRLVKRHFKKLGEEGFRILTKKPLTPAKEEVESNPRSRSAKLRFIEKE